MKKFKVVVRFKRRSEGMKEYKVGQVIECDADLANSLKGYVQPLEDETTVNEDKKHPEVVAELEVKVRDEPKSKKK